MGLDITVQAAAWGRLEKRLLLACPPVTVSHLAAREQRRWGLLGLPW
jgi:hypothetical protein